MSLELRENGIAGQAVEAIEGKRIARSPVQSDASGSGYSGGFCVVDRF